MTKASQALTMLHFHYSVLMGLLVLLLHLPQLLTIYTSIHCGWQLLNRFIRVFVCVYSSVSVCVSVYV